MRIIFNINYRTNWGESVYISGNIPELGSGDPELARKMEMTGSETWTLRVDAASLPDTLEYHYIVKRDNGPWRHEWGAPHRLTTAPGIDCYTAVDIWKDRPGDGPFYSSAFTSSILRRRNPSAAAAAEPGSVRIKVSAPTIRPGQVLALAGGHPALGNWDVDNAIVLSDANFPLWEAGLKLPPDAIHTEYKFLILDAESRKLQYWENGQNRVLSLPAVGPHDNVSVCVQEFRDPMGPWKGAGTAIPVFSVRTEDDFGTGDFISLKKMIDWCHLTNQKVLQLLPVNDTTKDGTWTDSYPYNANSTFALHPLYIRVEEAGLPSKPDVLRHFRDLKAELNALPTVDYERTFAAKTAWLKTVFAEQKKEITARPEFRRFIETNESWLKPYAAFCILRDKFGTPEMSEWKEYAQYTPEKADKVCNDNAEERDFIYFEQYEADRQLRHVRDYAHANGVVLKGDIPIGIARHSVDAWCNPRLFNLDCQAGAPPDDFSAQGQNWGFPTYNWEVMARDEFAWWKARFRKMAEYFDAYRIDHVLGFFRIWQIPLDAVHGLLGYFNPALPFSADELRGSYDFWINPDIQTRPYIMEWMLHDFFGDDTDEARQLFLDRMTADRYSLKSFVDTQKKVEKYFDTLPHSEKNEKFRNALMGLIDDVLFIEDPYEKGKYHPRIAAQFTYQYRALNDYERWCFDRLYNDFFYRRHNDFWYGKAMWKLPPIISATGMLTCAEDLGMIPYCVPEVMRRLQILSLEIQRMPKDPGQEFANTWDYPYFSVCTTSTHDMPGIRGWWESDHAMSQRYFNNVLHEQGAAPYFAEPWVCSRIVELQLVSPSMLCILPIQDWLATDATLRREKPADEQINIPAISRHYWRYRMHITVEKLLDSHDFNESVRRMIDNSGR